MSNNNKSKRKLYQKKIVNRFPCKECITLPICMNIEYKRNELIAQLISKCSLIDHYIIGNGTRKKSKDRLYSQLTQMRERELYIINFFNSKKE